MKISVHSKARHKFKSWIQQTTPLTTNANTVANGPYCVGRKSSVKRTVLCWQEKLDLLEDDVITTFIAVATCVRW